MASKFLQAIEEPPDGGGTTTTTTTPPLYSTMDAFEAFISEGGNVALYGECVRALARTIGGIEKREEWTLLDLGCGTGRLLGPVLEMLESKPKRVVLVDSERQQWARSHDSYEFVETCFEDLELTSCFDICVSSFAFHYCKERERVLRHVSGWVNHMIVFEFDVPEGLTMDRDAMIERYLEGCKEYEGSANEELVVEGFLVPVFKDALGSPMQEMSMGAWESLFAGHFKRVSARHVCEYWWSPCFELVASSHTHLDGCAHLDERAMEVVEYGEKGRGYRAKCDIAAGTTLLIEQPMVTRLGDDAERYRAIAEIVGRGLAPYEHAYEYLLENSFRSGSQVLTYALKSMFNHSCWPNCASSDDASRVYAFRDVAEGEELCISYVEGLLWSKRTAIMLLPTKHRSRHLVDLFEFECKCSRCVDDWDPWEDASQEEDIPANLPPDLVNYKGPVKNESVMLPSRLCTDPSLLEQCIKLYEQRFPKGFPATQQLKQMK